MKKNELRAGKKAAIRQIVKNWCAAFQKEDEARAGVVLQNIIYDCKNGRVEDEALKAFCAELRRKAGSPPAAAVIRNIVKARTADLVCKGKDKPAAAQCSRIMDANDFLAKNIHLHRVSKKIQMPDTPSAIQELQRGGLRKITKNRMGHERPFVWVTKKAAIDKLRASVPAKRLADELRDQLGLNHLRDTEHLVEVVYPEDEAITLRAPTFLEGSDIVFRSHRGSDGWGRTVNLLTLDLGLPEAVHLPIDFDERFSVRDVGRLTRCTGFSFSKLLVDWTTCPVKDGGQCKCLIQKRLAR